MKHTISLYISSFTSVRLYVYTSYPLPTIKLPRFNHGVPWYNHGTPWFPMVGTMDNYKHQSLLTMVEKLIMVNSMVNHGIP